MYMLCVCVFTEAKGQLWIGPKARPFGRSMFADAICEQESE